LSPTPEFQQDHAHRGWPWIETTFSWAEPTNWCLLALKKLRRMNTANGTKPTGATPAATLEGVKPWRAAVALGAFAAIELAVGAAGGGGTQPGDRLCLTSSPSLPPTRQ
jgi:hypothetical protein